MVPFLSVSDSIQGRSHVHSFCSEILTHVLHPCLCFLRLSVFPPRGNIMSVLVISCRPFLLNNQNMLVFFSDPVDQVYHVCQLLPDLANPVSSIHPAILLSLLVSAIMHFLAIHGSSSVLFKHRYRLVCWFSLDAVI